jgi:hypothetical protein
MNLRPEVLRRLLLAKSVLMGGRNAPLAGQPNAHVVAREILNAHDAADLVFAAIADQQNRLPQARKDSMMQCLEAINTTGDKHTGYFKQVNDARNSLKHSGVLPNTSSWASVISDVFEKLSSLCKETLAISLDDLDESELVLNDEARTHLAAAKKFREAQDFKGALGEIGKALFVGLDGSLDVGAVQVGRARAEDALKLTAFGISANDFLRLQEFLPMVSGWPSSLTPEREPLEVHWKQSGFGHPGNWRDDVVDFCMSACLGVLLGIQNASPLPYARHFSDTYNYKVTAKEDQVEVWEDLIDNALDEIYADDTRPFRTHKRFLNKGESLHVSMGTKPFVSEDISLTREPIKRVQISPNPKSTGFWDHLLGEPARGEFVNLADVTITCVAQDWTKEMSLSLPDIPWEEDPLIFRLHV